ncbi:helix-turn-helix domain-containing protein [Caldimonas sp.]|uniref:helix-turn-helix domain-containing protein n=1 Tax=Caldimonas sp. TaxID=2838790 RepID=UPI00307E7DC3
MASVQTIGRALQRFRHQRGLSLAGLSERSGVAKSTLSQLENGEGNPTIETLWAVANALGVPFGVLIDDGGGEQPAWGGPGVHVRLIERSRDDPEIEVYTIELLPGCRKESAPHLHGVKERVTVLAGTMLAGPADRPRLLRSGETHVFEADVPHVYAAHEHGARALVLIEYPPKAYGGCASTLYVPQPADAAAWEGLLGVLERALLEVSNGLGVRLLRLRGEPEPGRDGRQLWAQALAELQAGPWPWPVHAFVEEDAQGPFIGLVPMLACSAFSGEWAPQAWSAQPLPQRCLRLARWAQSPTTPLGEDDVRSLVADLESPSWVLNGLALEVSLQRGQRRLPRVLRAGLPEGASCPERSGPLGSRIDVEQYDAFELLHPAYARQVVAAAQDIASAASAPPSGLVIDVGSGPGLPLLMLRELHPSLEFLAVEPDEAAYACLQRRTGQTPGIETHRGDFLALEWPAARTSLITSFGASHHLNTAFMLHKAAALLQPGGLLVVADEFLPEFTSVEERHAALVRHHGAYLLASMAWVGEPWPQAHGEDARLYRDFRRTVLMASMAAAEGRGAQAVGMCRQLYARLCDSEVRRWPQDELGAFVRFYWLELQAMVAGFDYEVERKTFARRFAGLAALAGLELVRHRRVFATVGQDDWGGGTHVFTFRKPQTA